MILLFGSIGGAQPLLPLWTRLFYHCLRFAAESYFRISLPHLALCPLSFYEFGFLTRDYFLILAFSFLILAFNSWTLSFNSFTANESLNFLLFGVLVKTIECFCLAFVVTVPNSDVVNINLKDIPLEVDAVEASTTVTTGLLVNLEGTFSGSASSSVGFWTSFSFYTSKSSLSSTMGNLYSTSEHTAVFFTEFVRVKGILCTICCNKLLYTKVIFKNKIKCSI